MDLLRERVYKFGRNVANLVWRQEKLISFSKLFEKALENYVERQKLMKAGEALFAPQQKTTDNLTNPSTNIKLQKS